jgi:hypothetical protein
MSAPQTIKKYLLASAGLIAVDARLLSAAKI